MSARFSSVIENDGIIVTLKKRRVLSWQVVPVEEWGALTEAEKVGAAPLLGLFAADEASLRGEGLWLPNRIVISLPQAIADIIGLPPISPLSVTLSFEGRVEQTDSRIRMRWYDANVRPTQAKRTGVQIEWNSEIGRLSRPLYELAESIEGFNATQGKPSETRIASWQPVQTALQRTTGRDVKADEYLGSLTIYQAGSFALDVRETRNGPDFLPVLMSRSKASSLEDNAPTGELTDEQGEPDVDLRDQSADALLPPDLQRAFERNHFSHAAAVRDAYVLAPNMFLVVDQELKSALDVVRTMRGRSSDQRRAFLRNPRPAIAAALPESQAQTASVFVETKQYSERVLGIGAWAPPLLPWLKKRIGQWLPESFPLRIGERTLTLSPEGLSDLEGKYVSASIQDMPTIEVQGEVFSTVAIGTALKELQPPISDDQSPPAPDAAPADIVGPPSPAGAVQDTEVLQIKTNIDGVEFQIEHRPRRPRISRDLPIDRLGRNLPKPHQTEGFAWLVNAWSAGWPGVLLADDMGLGKTYQALAFLAWLRKNQDEGASSISRAPMLIVAPTALLRNWLAEAELHLARGALGECVEAFGYGISRLKRAKDSDWTPEDALDLDVLRRADWILTTYETLADNHRAFARVPYSIVIFDEMQKIKAPGTINTHSAKALNAEFVLGMTGTPIENRIEDLWCIMDRVSPGYLGDLKDFSAIHGEENPSALTKLKAKLDEPLGAAPAVMLRRMKETILEGLPTKTVEKYNVIMPPHQADAYAKAVAMARDSGRDRGAMLKALHAFRGISLHPDGADEIDQCDAGSVASWMSRSARLSKAVELLRTIRGKSEKAIVFVEDRAVQKTFAAAAPSLFGLATEPAIINGEVQGDKRQAIVDRFQKDRSGFGLLVLSPKAAGIGLTITAANHVIHLSRWWNPAVEDQCNDRVYRIGQDLPVTIHVPIAVHPVFGEASFDQTLDRLLESKRALSRHMLAPPVQENDIATLFGAALGE